MCPEIPKIFDSNELIAPCWKVEGYTLSVNKFKMSVCHPFCYFSIPHKCMKMINSSESSIVENKDLLNSNELLKLLFSNKHYIDMVLRLSKSPFYK